MPLPFLTVTSQAKAPVPAALYLDADSFGRLTVQYDPKPTARWHILLCDSERDEYMFVNQNSGLALTAGDDNVSLTMTDASVPTARNTWHFRKKTSFDGSLVALWIQPVYNRKLNLNVRGNNYPAGTEVILYEYQEHPNSKWNIG